MADSPKLRAVLYARVSTKHKDQDPENQLVPLRAHAKSHNWRVVEEIIEHESASGRVKRKQFARMMHEATQGKFDVVAFWSLDRFGREGATQTLLDLRTLATAKVGWFSVQEPMLDTSQLGVFRDVIIALIAAVAELETHRRSERAKAAIERKRAAGQQVGGIRKPLDEAELAKMVKAEYTHAALARHFQVSRGTIISRIRELRSQGVLDAS